MFNVRWGIISAVTAFLLALTTGLLTSHISVSTTIMRAILFATLFFCLGTGVWMLVNKFLPELLSSDMNNDDPMRKLFSSVDSSGDGGDNDTQLSRDQGQKVNITLGDSHGSAMQAAAIPGKNSEAHNIDAVGNIADLVSGAINPLEEAKKNKDIDQTLSNSYTENTGNTGNTSDTGDFAPVTDDPAMDNSNIASDFPPGLPDSLQADGDDGDFSLNFSSFVPSSTGIPELDSFTSFHSAGSGGNSEENTTDDNERRTTGNKPTAFEGDFNPKEIASGLRTVLEKDKKG